MSSPVLSTKQSDIPPLTKQDMRRQAHRGEILSANPALVSGRRMFACASTAYIFLVAMTKKPVYDDISHRTPAFLFILILHP